MEGFCSSKCRSAGFCCNDYRIGSNQMISCTQACMMRARGSSHLELSSAQGGLCRRTGSSGCSLTVNGFSYGFCWSCKDLTNNQKCRWGVTSSEACDYGASLTPTPEEYCSFRCKDAGYCCNDYKTGSNQMISCAQACMMRTRGASWTDLATATGGMCRRTGSSGCSLTANGHSYGFCSRCSDVTANPKCHWGVANSAVCDFGASLPPSNFGLAPTIQRANMLYP